MKNNAAKKPIAFEFVLEELAVADPVVRAMFGCHAVYVRDKLVLMLRDKPGYRDDNGVWIATTVEHHASLKKDFPCMRTITVFGSNETAWQNLPVDHDDFEEAVLKACKLIIKGDPRIGRITKSSVKNTGD